MRLKSGYRPCLRPRQPQPAVAGPSWRLYAAVVVGALALVHPSPAFAAAVVLAIPPAVLGGLILLALAAVVLIAVVFITWLTGGTPPPPPPPTPQHCEIWELIENAGGKLTYRLQGTTTTFIIGWAELQAKGQERVPDILHPKDPS